MLAKTSYSTSCLIPLEVSNIANALTPRKRLVTGTTVPSCPDSRADSRDSRVNSRALWGRGPLAKD